MIAIAWVVLCVLAVFPAAGVVIPLVRGPWWFVRIWAFPRVQFIAAAGVGLLATVALGIADGFGPLGWVLACVFAVVLVVHAWCVAPYTRVWPARVPGGERADLRLMVSNVDVRNEDKAGLAAMLCGHEADVLLLIEVDEAWWEVLGSVRERYAYGVERLRDEGLGIALLSKFALRDVEVREIVSERRPSIWATVELGDGRRVRFAGLHPTPPALSKRHGEGRYDSGIRDAELVLAAETVAETRDEAWIVAGDMNDVAWSRTTSLFCDLSGLEDPRVGRGMVNTYHARYPLLRYPLDHVFVSPGFRVCRFERARAPGSDHFAVRIDLGLAAREGPEPNADTDEQREAGEMVEEGCREARANGEG